MASWDMIRRYARRQGECKTTLRTADGTKVSIKGIAAERTVGGVVSLAAAVGASLKGPGMEMGETSQGEGAKLTGESARLAVAAVLGNDGPLLAAVRAAEETEAAAVRAAATAKAKALAEAEEEAADRRAAAEAAAPTPTPNGDGKKKGKDRLQPV